jgi:hypothetical protein
MLEVAHMSENSLDRLITFIDARREIEKFEKTLAEYQIRIATASDLELVAIIISEMEDVRTGRTPYNRDEDPRPTYRKAVGLLEFVTMLNSQHTRSGLGPFVAHL